MDYARLKQSADKLLARVNQGQVDVSAVTVSDGATDLDAPMVSHQWERYDAAFRGVTAQYVDGTTILASDLMGVMEADTTAAVGGYVRINGIPRVIVRVDNIPASGTVVAKRVFVRGGDA